MLMRPLPHNTVLFAAHHVLQSHTGSRHDLLVRLRREIAKHIADGACTGEQAEQTLESLLPSLGKHADVQLYTVTMHAYAVAGRAADCERLLEALHRRGLQASVVTHSTLLHAHGQAGDLQACVRVCQRMEAAGVQPNTVTYSTLAQALARAGQTEAAERAIVEMEGRGLRADTVTCSVLLGMCGRLNGQWRTWRRSGSRSTRSR